MLDNAGKNPGCFYFFTNYYSKEHTSNNDFVKKWIECSKKKYGVNAVISDFRGHYRWELKLHPQMDQ